MVSLPIAALLFLSPAPVQTPAPPPAFEYSDGYRLRAKIHRIGSFAMLPLAGTEFYLGQSIFTTPNEGRKSAHVTVGAALGTLFAVNTVTGVWNLVEARKDPNGRTKRWVHGILMLVADAGFVATAALAPDDDASENGRVASASLSDRRARHRTVALGSLAVGTVGYLVILLGK